MSIAIEQEMVAHITILRTFFQQQPTVRMPDKCLKQYTRLGHIH